MRNSLISRGKVHVYTGDGKGKTTAALGLALRVIGWGGKVCVVQFIKGYSQIGEAFFADSSSSSLTLKQFAEDPSPRIDECDARARSAEARAALDYARVVLASGQFDLVVLDEVNNAMHYNLVTADEVLGMIRNLPVNVELVLTGRGAPREIVEAADYVTEMRSVKHPMERGVRARKGIDY